MRKVESLKVLYHHILVGRMTMGTNGTCLFQYDREWLDTGFSISPLKLPLIPELFEAELTPFGGNFGVFEDSIPGGYGEYMLTKELRKHGVNYMELDPLQKLSIFLKRAIRMPEDYIWLVETPVVFAPKCC